MLKGRTSPAVRKEVIHDGEHAVVMRDGEHATGTEGSTGGTSESIISSYMSW